VTAQAPLSVCGTSPTTLSLSMIAAMPGFVAFWISAQVTCGKSLAQSGPISKRFYALRPRGRFHLERYLARSGIVADRISALTINFWIRTRYENSMKSWSMRTNFTTTRTQPGRQRQSMTASSVASWIGRCGSPGCERMTQSITESVIEEPVLAWLEALGCQVAHRAHIAANTLAPIQPNGFTE